jgi:hypothetical protein
MMSMMIDWVSMTFSYFMRSQNRTYATDSAKKAIVTAIQRTSCIGIPSALSAGSRSQSPIRRSVGGAPFLLLNLRTHRDKYPALPHSSRPAWCMPYLFEQSHQKAKPKQHRGEAQNCQRYSHNPTGLRFASRLLTFIGQLRA